MEQLQRYGFFVEHDRAQNGTGHSAGLPWLELQTARARLVISNDDHPRVVPMREGEESENSERGNLTSPVFEIVRHDFQSYLAMMAPPVTPIRVNGLRTGPVCILKVKDQLEVSTDCVLHVSVQHKPDVGFPNGIEVGNDCLVCRTPIAAEQTVFRCTYCGTAMHCGGPDRAEYDRLECAIASTDCPRCRRRLVREEGYEYVPEI